MTEVESREREEGTWTGRGGGGEALGCVETEEGAWNEVKSREREEGSWRGMMVRGEAVGCRERSGGA
jgi:hypothetical protein